MFSPQYAYPTEFPEPQYHGAARYPGNTVFANTTGLTAQQSAAKVTAIDGVLTCPVAYGAVGVVGAILSLAVNYAAHYKKIKGKKNKVKTLWKYPVQGLFGAPAAMAGGLALLRAYHSSKVV